MMLKERPSHPAQALQPPSRADRVQRQRRFLITQSDDAPWVVKYRWFCFCTHLKVASTTVNAVDFVLFIVPAVRGVHLYMNTKTNPAVTGWMVTWSLLFCLSMFGIFASWYGTWAERSQWILPKLVLKAFTIVICCSTVVGLVYLHYNRSRLLEALAAQSPAGVDFITAQENARFGAQLLIAIVVVFTVVQLWFLVIIYDCYRYVRDREWSNEVSKIVREEEQRMSGFATLKGDQFLSGHRNGKLPSTSSTTVYTTSTSGPPVAAPRNNWAADNPVAMFTSDDEDSNTATIRRSFPAEVDIVSTSSFDSSVAPGSAAVTGDASGRLAREVCFNREAPELRFYSPDPLSLASERCNCDVETKRTADPMQLAFSV